MSIGLDLKNTLAHRLVSNLLGGDGRGIGAGLLHGNGPDGNGPPGQLAKLWDADAGNPLAPQGLGGGDTGAGNATGALTADGGNQLVDDGLTTLPDAIKTVTTTAGDVLSSVLAPLKSPAPTPMPPQTAASATVTSPTTTTASPTATTVAPTATTASPVTTAPSPVTTSTLPPDLPPGHLKQFVQELTGLPRNVVNGILHAGDPRSQTIPNILPNGPTQPSQARGGQAPTGNPIVAARETIQALLNPQPQPRNPSSHPNAQQALANAATNLQQTILARQPQLPGNPAAQQRPETPVPQTASQPQGALLRANEQAVPLPPRNEQPQRLAQQLSAQQQPQPLQQQPLQQMPPRADQPGLLQHLSAMLFGTTAATMQTQAPPAVANPRGAEMAAGLTMATAPTIAERPLDARLTQLPANDRARNSLHEAPVLPVYTAEGTAQRRLGRRAKVLPATLTHWLWALGLAGDEIRARGADTEQQGKDIFRALQWLFWLLAITAYGCLGFALLMLLPAGGSVPRPEAADATGGAVLAIGLVAAAAAWWLARQAQNGQKPPR